MQGDAQSSWSASAGSPPLDGFHLFHAVAQSKAPPLSAQTRQTWTTLAMRTETCL